MCPTTLLFWIVLLIFPETTLGVFNFKAIPEDNQVFCAASSGPCAGTTRLLWNYETDEIVTAIEWYKQPGKMIARLTVDRLLTHFKVFAPYNTTPYTVRPYITSKYNAGLQIDGLSEVDEGVYSVNIRSFSQHSSNLTRRIGAPLADKPIVGCKPITCTSPTTADSVKEILTQKDGKLKCDLKFGNAACSCEPIYDEVVCKIDESDEGTEHMCYAFVPFIPLVLIQIVFSCTMKRRYLRPIEECSVIMEIVLFVPLFDLIYLLFRLRTDKKKDKQYRLLLFKNIWINFCTIIGGLALVLMYLNPWLEYCEIRKGFRICVATEVGLCFAGLLPLGPSCFSYFKEPGHYSSEKSTKAHDQQNEVCRRSATRSDKPEKQDTVPTILANFYSIQNNYYPTSASRPLPPPPPIE